MGAVFNCFVVPEQIKDKYVINQHFMEVQDQDRHENGNSYSGGFGMAYGLVFKDIEFPTKHAAAEWLDQNAEKWGPALCVAFKHAGRTRFIIGALCSS